MTNLFVSAHAATRTVLHLWSHAEDQSLFHVVSCDSWIAFVFCASNRSTNSHDVTLKSGSWIFLQLPRIAGGPGSSGRTAVTPFATYEHCDR